MPQATAARSSTLVFPASVVNLGVNLLSLPRPTISESRFPTSLASSRRSRVFARMPSISSSLSLDRSGVKLLKFLSRMLRGVGTSSVGCRSTFLRRSRSALVLLFTPVSFGLASPNDNAGSASRSDAGVGLISDSHLSASGLTARQGWSVNRCRWSDDHRGWSDLHRSNLGITDVGQFGSHRGEPLSERAGVNEHIDLLCRDLLDRGRLLQRRESIGTLRRTGGSKLLLAYRSRDGPVDDRCHLVLGQSRGRDIGYGQRWGIAGFGCRWVVARCRDHRARDGKATARVATRLSRVFRIKIM